LIVSLLLTGVAAADTTTIVAPSAEQRTGDIRWLMPAEERPKVALVLSGGGARGFAHLGVLQAWEDAGAPLDFIVGTSIGGTLGGLYAAGYGADSLTRLARSTRWAEFLSNSPPRRSLFLSRRRENEQAIIELRFDGLKPTLPTALSSGQKLSGFLSELTRAVDYQIDGDFDRLRIPLRVVATDLVTGERVVIGSGNLGDALRSTVAVPLAFTPWETGGRLLADGGLVDPIPVDVARELGADIVVAVNTTSPLLPKDELTDPFALANQATSVMVLARQTEQLERADRVVTPDLNGINNSDFHQVDSLVELGYEAARPVLAQLLAELGQHPDTANDHRSWRVVSSSGHPKFAHADGRRVSESELRGLLREAIRKGEYREASVDVVAFSDSAHLEWRLEPLPRVTSVEITGSRILSEDSLRSDLQPLIGTIPSGPGLQAALAALETRFKSAGYPLVAVDSVALDGRGRLRLHIDEAPVTAVTFVGNGRTRTSFLNSHLPHLTGKPLHAPDLDRGISSLYATGLFQSVTARNAHHAGGSEVQLRVVEQDFTRLRLGFHWHEEFHAESFGELADINILGTGHTAAARVLYGDRRKHYALTLSADRLFQSYLAYRLSVYHMREHWRRYERTDEVPGSFRFERTGGRFSVGQQLRRFGLLSVGLRLERIDAELALDRVGERLDLRSLWVEAALDTYDRYPVPGRGYRQELLLERAEDELGGNVQYTKFRAHLQGVVPLGHNHATIVTFEAGTADTRLPESERFLLGGRNSFLGWRTGEGRGDHYWTGSLALRLHNGGRRFVTLLYNLGNIWTNGARIDLLDVDHGVAAAYTIDSPAGPLDFAVGIAEDRPLIGYVNLGFSF
jgi:NTE family protein